MKSTPRLTGGLWICALLAILALTWLNWRHPHLRLTVPFLNLMWWQAALLSPLLAGWIAIKRFSGPVRVALLVAVGLIGTVTVPLSLLATLSVPDIIRTGETPFLKKLDQVQSGKRSIVAYRTNGGATTDYGVHIRAERLLMPGVVAVKPLYDEYHVYDAKLALAGTDVRTVITRDGVDTPGPVFRLED